MVLHAVVLAGGDSATSFSFYLPTKVVFGFGSLDALSAEARALSANRPLIVTDRVMVKTGIVEKVTAKLGDVHFEVFDGVEAEPRLEVAEAVADRVRRDTFDAVIGVGGGSAMDMAKVAAAFATNPGPPKQYVGNNLFARRPLPSIMVPTTAGTGAELTVTSMVTVAGHKQWINSPLLLPSVAVVDPELTITMPKSVTAATGLDALSHNTEAYLSDEANVITDAAALEGIKLVSGNLVKAYSDGNDRKAREAMSLGALLGGIALHARMVYGHSIGYTVATRFNLPHGVSCGIPLPYIIARYAEAVAPKMQKLAEAYGVDAGSREPKKLGEAIAQKVKGILAELGVPRSLKELGVKEADLPNLADECLKTYGRTNSPVVFDAEKMNHLYTQMWQGISE
ncbi:MAG: iron-containing alcohol dehydrogenase [Nitrososphaerota archaeon]|nr:iron-containing alcohol dehydrogenase [Nitrososphaerota archaeon]MDG7026002.1 iron-containing alcohol dehydrogenase [Nitrososphaerota archaeon]